tara:strand:- start:490 stop:771 length:282 start_codon:yes stop_codon:yes gene_type:complete
MEIKLKSKKILKIKNITLDERDDLLDSVKYKMNKKGEFEGVEMMHSTMTKWIRTCIDGDTSDETIMKMTLADKTEIFSKLQSVYLLGEGNASK